MERDDFDELAGLWLTRLRSTRSPNTCYAYQSAIRALLKWCGETGREPELSRALIEAFTADTLEAGANPATAQLRHIAFRGLSAYIAEQTGEPDGLAGLKSPRRIKRVVPKLAPGELAALLKECAGTDFYHRRDTAIVRLFADTGVRSDELLRLKIDDVSMPRALAHIHGKGSRERTVPFTGRTAESLGWYIRARRKHKDAGLPWLWLSQKGRLTYAGLYNQLGKRAQAAGIERFHPHRLRHTFASTWLDRGGSESGLRAIAGWSDPAMLARYVEDTQRERAIREARELGIGDEI